MPDTPQDSRLTEILLSLHTPAFDATGQPQDMLLPLEEIAKGKAAIQAYVAEQVAAARPTAIDTKNFRRLTKDYLPTLRHWATALPEEEFDRILTEYGSKVFALGFRDVNRLIKEQVKKQLTTPQDGDKE